MRWRIENELADPTAAAWRENDTAARGLVEDRLGRSSPPPYDPTSVEVDVDGDTLVVEFVDRGAARQRLGLLVLPYLHGEGVQARYVVNADEFAVRAPDGQRVVNDPVGATVRDDRAVWTGVAAIDDPIPGAESWAAPEPGDACVVVGSGATAGVRAGVVTALEPLDPPLYGAYALGSLLVAGLTYGIYTTQAHTFEPRLEAAAIATATLPYLYLVARLHPPQAGGLGAAVERVLAVFGTVLVGLIGGVALAWLAAVAGRRYERSSR